jgi:putative membrane protein
VTDQPDPTYDGASSAHDQAEDVPPLPDDPWRRQDARMLLVLPVQQLIRYFPAVIGLVIAGTANSDGEPWWFGLVAVVGSILLGTLRWFSTRYRITPDQLQLRTGLISRNTLTTRVDRVRTVDVTASLLHRVLGLAEVKIGTGTDETKLELDGLSAGHAARLREELIHARNAATAPDPGADPDELDIGAEPGLTPPEPDAEIARLDPAWLKCSLLTSTGLASAAAIFGVGWQIIDKSGANPTDIDAVRQGEDTLQDLGVIAGVSILVVVAVVVVLLLSVVGYVLTYWGYRLTRNQRGGTLQVTRGLFTTRTTTIEERRLRGVEMSETLAMRPARGATLQAITTGLGSEASESARLLPPAPVAVARHVVDAVLTVPGVLSVTLRQHGPAAVRRRWVRAFLGGGMLAAMIVGATFWWQPSLGLLGVIPLALAVPLARDRARSLGHALTPRYLITRSGSLVRTTDVIGRTGVIGVTVRESFFQRRAGLSTVVMATAAGSESYEVLDVPVGDGVVLAAELLPGHLDPLCAVSPPVESAGP